MKHSQKRIFITKLQKRKLDRAPKTRIVKTPLPWKLGHYKIIPRKPGDNIS